MQSFKKRSVVLSIIFLCCIIELGTATLIGTRCKNSKKVNGTCKYIKDCPEFRDAVSFPITHICGVEGRQAIVCCENQTKTCPLWSLQRKGSRRYIQECERYKSQIFDRIISFTNLIANGEQTHMQVSNCSQYTFPLVSGGENANPKEFPHMALLGCVDKKRSKLKWICGGTLISPNFILTAGHCIEDIACETITHVRLGELNFDATDDDALPRDYSVEKVITHPDYKDPIKYNDVGLIKLKTNVQFNEYVRPACLPYEDFSEDCPLIITGWGAKEHAGLLSPHLQKAGVELFTKLECNDAWGEVEDDNLPTGIKEGAQMCIGSKHSNKDTCTGDSGGPLQIVHPNHQCMYSVVGITSAGQGCGHAGIPGIYTRTLHYIDWIEKEVWG